ncbi:MAG: 2Fe-2S iron-sulfur cluster-binding protein [Novosphingobium sp.]
MKDVILTLANGDRRDATISPGQSLMEAIREAEPDGVAALCGGNCSCGTCHVYVDRLFMPQLPEIEIEEEELLSGIENSAEQSRLSCQLSYEAVPDGLRITVPPPID